MQDKITVKGARTHNLKNITVEMPRNKMIVFTGLSGSGKSSLAFDTIFAEGQRRYVESLSAYARQFLNQMQKPDVDEITGLSPAISIDQKSRSNNPRSTVATITEIYDYLRILYARVGTPHCLICDKPIQRLSNEEIQKMILAEIDSSIKKGDTTHVEIMSPIVRGRKGEYYQLLYDLLGRGYTEIFVDGIHHNLREQIILSKNKKHEIDIIVDKILISDFATDKKSAQERLRESIEKALDEADGLVRFVFNKDAHHTGKKTNEIGTLISSKFTCPNDGYSFPEIEPRLFSFNSPYGACPDCNGLGTKHFFGDEPCDTCNGARLRPEAMHIFIKERRESGRGKGDTNSKKQDEKGKRFNIVNFTDLSIKDALELVNNLDLTEQQKEISKVITKEIEDRIRFMKDVGIEYITLNRRANTLSGGEAQRIRLASQLGSKLVGALYVLDEPTIGLHQRDNERLVNTLTNLRDMGNTIIVVEHDEDTIFASDYIVDIGPLAGIHGGEIIVADYLAPLLEAKTNKSGSITLDYLRGDKKIELPEVRRERPKGELKIKGGNVFNLKNVNLEIPLGRFNAITGVSGSGKSSLMYEIIHKNLRARFDRRYRTATVYNCKSFSGTEYLSRAIMIDQSAIGRTSRSNPATYTGAFNHIRDLFASTSEARVRGWKPGRFSFNVKGGRCEACEGKGEIAVEMHFLPTVYVPCDICGGKRFTKETLEVRYKEKNIYEVLNMTIEEALTFFEDIPAIYDRIKTLNDVGLGYLVLGQSATTLSGGEAQRVKISSELYRSHVQKTIYLLDEPTVGLHYEDVKKLIEILQKLVDEGNTVIVIEHNLDLIKCADYVIDLGPDGGEHGGMVVGKGTPEELTIEKKFPKSYTGKYLDKILTRDRRK
ncbi:excinuclease ABC subunit A [Candidatus Campbellbacteria bacterium CG22_combo_CG10-13_8_21_14_all_36_13]|uniref:UvrABC system protein A n=1 Tax=Candidatus Campbellbacteria bacterium CG22_combo_CG10-13_8_21_14_all_36_13 TaxID=1974529 RepID=A0A2H0DXY3_9BACT|nr:MAG: excinuclease ABC subunit A [Candidatus Campbellbacteria bacterium CG22_combo_CG10-13_8_21_14_all_36_13]